MHGPRCPGRDPSPAPGVTFWSTMSEEDPKEVAKKERKTPQVERLLRQFLKTDGPKGATNAYKEGWERIFGNKCQACDGFGTIAGRGKCVECDGTGNAVLPE